MDFVAKGLAKEVFSTKHVIQRILITRRKVREDVGSVSLKQANGFHQLSCDVATHHKGWLSKAADGTLSWEFSSRGLKYLKGEAVPVANEKGLALSIDFDSN